MQKLERLRGGLIVSCQARAGSPLDDPAIIAAMAAVAVENGAVAVRIQGAGNIAATRKRVSEPIIGLIKREHPGFEPYITATFEEVRQIVEAGADIVAYDATLRARPHYAMPQHLQAEIQKRRALAMADCSYEEDARVAIESGADIVATTLAGYTKETTGISLPALELVRRMRASVAGRTPVVVCEGGIHSPEQAAAAMAAGADAVVVGTAITNLEWQVRRFADGLVLER